MLLVLTSTADNQRGPRYAEQVFANLSRYPFTLLVLSVSGSATIALRCRAKHHHAISRELQAAYPDLKINKESDTILATHAHRLSRSLILRPDYFQLRRHTDFFNESDRTVSDPIASLLAAVAPQASLKTVPMIALQCRPVLFLLRRWFSRKCVRKGEPDKGNHELYRCRLRISVVPPTGSKRLARRKLHELQTVFT